MQEKSCGTVSFTRRNGTILYLLIQKNDGYCSFPKGHVEENETEEETALRETWEETSVSPRIIKGFRRETQYPLRNGKNKTVVYFLADMGEQRPAHNAGFEHFQYLLLPYKEALTALTFENTRDVLRAADGYVIEHLSDF